MTLLMLTLTSSRDRLTANNTSVSHEVQDLDAICCWLLRCRCISGDLTLPRRLWVVAGLGRGLKASMSEVSVGDCGAELPVQDQAQL